MTKQYEVYIHYTHSNGDPRYEVGTLSEDGYFTRRGRTYLDSELDSCVLRTAGPVQRGANVEISAVDADEAADVERIGRAHGINAKVDRFYA